MPLQITIWRSFAVALLLALVSCVATIHRTKLDSDLELALRMDEMSPDQTYSLLFTHPNKQTVGSVTVEDLLALDTPSLALCSNAEQLEGRWSLHMSLSRFKNAYLYCQDRLGKQADLCARRADELLESALSHLSDDQKKAVDEFRVRVLAETKARRDAWFIGEKLSRFLDEHKGQLAASELEPIKRACSIVVEHLAALEQLPMFSKRFGKLKTPEQLDVWVANYRICAALKEEA